MDQETEERSPLNEMTALKIASKDISREKDRDLDRYIVLDVT